MNRIGIKSFSVQSLYSTLNIKNDLLFFEKLIVDHEGYKSAKGLSEHLMEFLLPTNPGIKDNITHNLNEIDYLESIGLVEVREMNIGIPSKEHEADMNLMKEVFKDLNRKLEVIKDESGNSFIDLTNRLRNYDIIWDFKTRHYNIQNFEKTKEELFPILINAESFHLEKIANKNTVIQFVLKKLPTLSDMNSWDEIIEFRKDLDTRAKYFSLINWINQVSNENLPIAEFEDKFNYLYYDYLNSLNLSKKKHKMSTLELLINGSATAIENILKLKFSDLSKSIFSISKNKINALEAELAIKNRELAYIHKVENHFSNGR
jgi:hypothetical protein